jgi:hypothetical protein
VPQQQRDRQAESHHHKAQEAQAPLEPGRDAFHSGEATQDRAGFLLKGRPALAALPVMVGDAIPGLRRRAASEKGVGKEGFGALDKGRCRARQLLVWQLSNRTDWKI